MEFDDRWGSRAGRLAGIDRAPFLEGDDIDQMPRWNEATIINAKQDVTRKGKKMLYVMFRHAENDWVHRQAYFSSQQLYMLLKLFDIHDGITDDSQINGKTVWLRFKKNQPSGSTRVFAEIAGYSLIKPQDEGFTENDVPF